VSLVGDKGTRTLRVTVAALLPEEPRNGYAEGGWLTDEGRFEIG
jgi:hypothetical protein